MAEEKKQLKDRVIYPTWDCSVVNNKIVVKDLDAYHTHLIPFEGKENLQITLKKKVKPRSRQEEKYYHAVTVKYVAEAMTITRDEAHELLKSIHLKVEESVLTSEGAISRYERTMSTTELGDARYREFWNDCNNWAALPTDGPLSQSSGLGIYIPGPNECDWEGKDDYIYGY